MSVIYVQKGTDMRVAVTARLQATGTPVDLTGALVTAEVLIGSATIAATVTVTDAAAGAYSVVVPASITGTWDVDTEGYLRMQRTVGAEIYPMGVASLRVN